ncbi:hypothetical protein PHYBLDRAFT_172422 [Phycomyces blakesleeanus NRRL 1555(-)]|uniref:MULE transposase domain-containing protein n=1 Tax=Phycomyces blakesleeanus (strain ATCC 8743b / DSM 1359 / FGSC 10004 / NBRC 33097 / NRRL 1555) TaxID=763407 RepID=A0A167KYC5_PHYB8|nr:hypothetical protein PHYBLDRAFT_172422 [Phycomyces blakesleeanus NRRL 1555(-)]OAD69167.1 hypothetical protein PHYBLDRAFT_172422 [Phycomyces blakesleeanus NRRL 1555(-)]|eukprot:XP_018287207.1 hypothetical protein PHYBLDRAFT_172422 [Phycomyces blakesleeanus NRRL 1555(-)]
MFPSIQMHNTDCHCTRCNNNNQEVSRVLRCTAQHHNKRARFEAEKRSMEVDTEIILTYQSNSVEAMDGQANSPISDAISMFDNDIFVGNDYNGDESNTTDDNDSDDNGEEDTAKIYVEEFNNENPFAVSGMPKNPVHRFIATFTVLFASCYVVNKGSVILIEFINKLLKIYGQYFQLPESLAGLHKMTGFSSITKGIKRFVSCPNCHCIYEENMSISPHCAFTNVGARSPCGCTSFPSLTLSPVFKTFVLIMSNSNHTRLSINDINDDHMIQIAPDYKMANPKVTKTFADEKKFTVWFENSAKRNSNWNVTNTHFSQATGTASPRDVVSAVYFVCDHQGFLKKTKVQEMAGKPKAKRVRTESIKDGCKAKITKKTLHDGSVQLEGGIDIVSFPMSLRINYYDVQNVINARLNNLLRQNAIDKTSVEQWIEFLEKKRTTWFTLSSMKVMSHTLFRGSLLDRRRFSNSSKHSYLYMIVVRSNVTNKGVPVCFFVTNAEFITTLLQWLNWVKSNCSLRVKCGMIDCSPVEIGALEEVFGQSVQVLLCHWHIKRAREMHIKKDVKITGATHKSKREQDADRVALNLLMHARNLLATSNLWHILPHTGMLSVTFGQWPEEHVIFLEKKEKQSADEKYGETLFIDEKRDDLLLLFAIHTSRTGTRFYTNKSRIILCLVVFSDQCNITWSGGQNASFLVKQFAIHNYTSMAISICDKINLIRLKLYGRESYMDLPNDPSGAQLWEPFHQFVNLNNDLVEGVGGPSVKEALLKYYRRTTGLTGHKFGDSVVVVAACLWIDSTVYSLCMYQRKKNETSRGNHYVMFTCPYRNWLVSTVQFYFQHVDFHGFPHFLAFVEVIKKYDITCHA